MHWVCVCVHAGGTGVGEFVFHTTKSLAGAGVSEPTKELVVYYGWAAGVLHTASVLRTVSISSTASV